MRELIERLEGLLNDNEMYYDDSDDDSELEFTDEQFVGEAKLSYAQRKKIPLSKFAIPERRAWPIHDVKHALTAIRFMVAGRGNSSEYPKVIKAIKKMWGKNEKVMAALKAAKSQLP